MTTLHDESVACLLLRDCCTKIPCCHYFGVSRGRRDYHLERVLCCKSGLSLLCSPLSQHVCIVVREEPLHGNMFDVRFIMYLELDWKLFL